MRLLVVVLTFAVLSATVFPAAAVPGDSARKGLTNACAASGNAKPCDKANVIPETTVGPGETRTWSDKEHRVEGTIVVATGGTAVVEDATFVFADSSDGILVQPGGTLRVLRSLLREADGGSEYRLDLAPGSAFTLNLTTVRGGSGIKLATSDVSFSGNVIEQIPLALHMVDVTATLHHNTFRDNDVAVNQTGGVPTLAFNRFEGGTTCVRDWLSDPTIVYNVFRGCHVGIFHERSESTIVGNDLEDQINPPGGGIIVRDTMSPIIEDNTIRRYGTGIVVENARAFIRNNTIEENVVDGVRVVGNSAPMDIQGNRIAGNGRHGVFLSSVADVLVRDNDVLASGAIGILVSDGTGVSLEENRVEGTGSDGIFLAAAPSTNFVANRVVAAGRVGVWVGTGSAGVTLVAPEVLNATTIGVFSDAPSTWVHNASVVGSGWEGIHLRGAFARVVGGHADANGDHGLAIVQVANASVEDFSAAGNGEDGLHFRFSGGYLDGVRVEGNARYGVFFDVGTNFTGPPTIFHSLVARHNTVAGLVSWNGAPTAQGSWIEGNGDGVINHDPTLDLDARHSYWGSATGPTHPDNPGGTGDTVQGRVLYDPFLAGPPGTASAIA